MENRTRSYGRRMIPDKIIDEVNDRSPSYQEPNGPETKNGTIANSLHVKVREQPSFESDVIEVLRAGDHVKILGKTNNNFYKVLTKKNEIAYISSDYIFVTEG